MSAVPKPISVDDVSIDGRWFGGKSGEYHKSSMTAGNQEIIISPSGALNGQAQYNFNYIGNSGAAIDLSQSYILTSFTTTVNYYPTPYSAAFGQLNQPVTETTPIALAPGASDMLFQDAQLRLNNVDVGDTFAGQLGQTQFARKMMTKKAGWWGRPSLRLPCMTGGGGSLPNGTGRGGASNARGGSLYTWGNSSAKSAAMCSGQLPCMDVGVAGGMGAMAGYICDEPGFTDISTGGYGQADCYGTATAGPLSNGAAVRYQRLTGLGYSPAECVVHMAADPSSGNFTTCPVTCISTLTQSCSAIVNSTLAYSMKKPILWGRQCTLRTNIPAGLAESAAFIPPGVSVNLTLQNAPTSQWMIYDNYSQDRAGGHDNHPWCIQQVNVNFTSVQLVLKTYTPSQLTSQSLAKAWALNGIIKLPHVRCRQWNTSFPGTVSSINQNILQGGTMPDLLVIAFGSGLGLGGGNAGISSVCWSPLSDQRDLQLYSDPNCYTPTVPNTTKEITTQGAGGGQYIPNVQAINTYVNGKQILTTPLGVASEGFDDVRSYLSYVFASTGSYEPSDSPALSFAQWSKSCRLYCFNLRSDQAPAGQFIPEDGAANITIQAQLTPGSAVAPFLVGGSEPANGPYLAGNTAIAPGNWNQPDNGTATCIGYQVANAARAASRSNVAMYAFMFNLAEIEIDSTLQVKKTFGF